MSHDPATGISWIVGGQWFARMKNWQLDHIYPLSGLSIKDVQPPVSACQDGYGGVYFVYYAQILYFHPQGGPERITPINGVVAEGGYHVMRDRENNIWITGMRGISQIISRRLACYDHNHGLQGDEVSAICRRASGTIVLGHRTGLTFLDSSTRTLTFGNDSGIMSRVIDLAEDARGDLWVAADRRGLGLLQNDGSLRWFGRDAGLGDPVYAILPDVKCPGGETALFVGTSHGLYKCTENRFEKVAFAGGKTPLAVDLQSAARPPAPARQYPPPAGRSLLYRELSHTSRISYRLLCLLPGSMAQETSSASPPLRRPLYRCTPPDASNGLRFPLRYGPYPLPRSRPGPRR